MFVGKRSVYISANRKDVYRMALTYPKFVSFFEKESRIILENEKTVEVEVHTKLLDFLPTKWRGVGIKKPFDAIYFTQTQGLFKGLTADWTFVDDKNGTIFSIETKFSWPKKFSYFENLIGTNIVEKTTEKILNELKRSFV